MPVCIARPFNTFGPRQSARAFVPTVITQALSGAKEIKLGSLHPTRDMNFVTDVAEGMLRVTECDKSVGRAVNICGMGEVTMGDLAAHIKEATASECALVTDDERVRPANSEVERLYGDNTLLRELTGWAPDRPLADALKLTVDWFKSGDNMAIYKPDIYNI